VAEAARIDAFNRKSAREHPSTVNGCGR
jgi:hypothetical protein